MSQDPLDGTGPYTEFSFAYFSEMMADNLVEVVYTLSELGHISSRRIADDFSKQLIDFHPKVLLAVSFLLENEMQEDAYMEWREDVCCVAEDEELTIPSISIPLDPQIVVNLMLKPREDIAGELLRRYERMLTRCFTSREYVSPISVTNGLEILRAYINYPGDRTSLHAKSFPIFSQRSYDVEDIEGGVNVLHLASFALTVMNALNRGDTLFDIEGTLLDRVGLPLRPVLNAMRKHAPLIVDYADETLSRLCGYSLGPQPFSERIRYWKSYYGFVEDPLRAEGYISFSPREGNGSGIATEELFFEPRLVSSGDRFGPTDAKTLEGLSLTRGFRGSPN